MNGSIVSRYLKNAIVFSSFFVFCWFALIYQLRVGSFNEESTPKIPQMITRQKGALKNALYLADAVRFYAYHIRTL